MTISDVAATESVTLSVDDGVAVVTLNRPERLNALTFEMEARYYDVLGETAADAAVRAVVVTGAGRGFCAGFDMDALGTIAAEGVAQGADAQPVRHTLPLSLPKPIIAAVNGPCAGLGLVLALMCDLRFAASGAKLTTAFVRRGLIAEHGISWMLPRLVGPSRALDLLLSGRVVLAEEAQRIGLVDEVVEPQQLLDRCLEYARDLATWCSPTAMAVIKRQVWTHATMDLDAAVAESNQLMLEAFTRPDMAEGVRSHVERRPPRFPPLTPAGQGAQDAPASL
jgi:enoyl-CoA hydratase/carnithine racemase